MGIHATVSGDIIDWSTNDDYYDAGSAYTVAMRLMRPGETVLGGDFSVQALNVVVPDHGEGVNATMRKVVGEGPVVSVFAETSEEEDGPIQGDDRSALERAFDVVGQEEKKKERRRGVRATTTGPRPPKKRPGWGDGGSSSGTDESSEFRTEGDDGEPPNKRRKGKGKGAAGRGRGRGVKDGGGAKGVDGAKGGKGAGEGDGGAAGKGGDGGGGGTGAGKGAGGAASKGGDGGKGGADGGKGAGGAEGKGGDDGKGGADAGKGDGGGKGRGAGKGRGGVPREDRGMPVGNTCFSIAHIPSADAIGATCGCHWDFDTDSTCKTSMALNLVDHDWEEAVLRMKRWLVRGLDIPSDSLRGKHVHMDPRYRPRALSVGLTAAECDAILEERGPRLRPMREV